jgi:ribosomal protein L25 (general stress protein Ctc)
MTITINAEKRDKLGKLESVRAAGFLPAVYYGHKKEATPIQIKKTDFIKAWKNIKKFDESKSFKTWIFTITKRTALDILRKKRSISFSSMDDNENDITFAESIPDENLYLVGDSCSVFGI